MKHDAGKSDDVSGNSDVVKNDVEQYHDVANDIEQYHDVAREERENAREIGSWPSIVEGSGKATYAEMAMKKVVNNIGSNFR